MRNADAYAQHTPSVRRPVRRGSDADSPWPSNQYAVCPIIERMANASSANRVAFLLAGVNRRWTSVLTVERSIGSFVSFDVRGASTPGFAQCRAIRTPCVPVRTPRSDCDRPAASGGDGGGRIHGAESHTDISSDRLPPPSPIPSQSHRAFMR